MPKVSVIIPIYCVENYIERCARSLFEQTLDDIEFIFVDDYTPDKSIEVLKRIIEEYPYREKQVRVIHHQNNRGLPLARQSGIKVATGDYIYNCDSDDWLELNMLQIMYIEACKTDADLVYCDFFKSYSDRECIIEESICTNYFEAILSDSNSPNVWNKLVKRELYSNSIMYPQKSMGEDFVLTLQLSYYAKNVTSVKCPLYHYRINPKSITNSKTEESVISNYYQLKANLDISFDFLSKNEHGFLRKYMPLRILYLKELLYPFLGTKKIFNLWLNTYPQYNYQIIFNNSIPIKNRLVYIYYFLKQFRLIKY